MGQVNSEIILYLDGEKQTNKPGHGLREKNHVVSIEAENLDSIFKSRDITLPTKVRLVKAMVFPVVMYGCESWIVKKAER